MSVSADAAGRSITTGALSLPWIIGASSVGHVCHEESFPDLLSHQLRWARTIRSIDLPGYLGSFIAHPFGLALLGAAAAGPRVRRAVTSLSESSSSISNSSGVATRLTVMRDSPSRRRRKASCRSYNGS